MHKLLLIGVLACFFLTSVGGGPAHAAEKSKKKTVHGAIAWNADTSQIGYSYDHPTARAAGVAALQECGHDRCTVAINFVNGCGALAAGPRTHAARKGNTRPEAETLALKACGAQCRNIAWACTR